MKWTLLIILLLPTFGSINLWAKGRKISLKRKGPQLQTEIHFGESNVLGRYEKATEARVIVENEKALINLVEPRKNLSFRIKQTKEWMP